MTEIADVCEVLIRPVAMAVIQSEGMGVPVTRVPQHEALRTLESEGQKWDEEARARQGWEGWSRRMHDLHRADFVPLNRGAPCNDTPPSEERLRELVDIALKAHPISDDPVERIRELRD